MKTFSIGELSAILKKSKSSIYSDACRNPSVLPPILRIPGSKRLLFVHVEHWLEQFVVVAPAGRSEKIPQRMGAPTKRERQNRSRAAEIAKNGAEKCAASHFSSHKKEIEGSGKARRSTK